MSVPWQRIVIISFKEKSRKGGKEIAVQMLYTTQTVIVNYPLSTK